MDERLLIILPLALAIAFAFLSAPLRATMYIIAFQKIIDILWFVRPNVGGFDLTVPRLLYTILPVVLFTILIVKAREKPFRFKMPPIIVLIIIYVFWYAFSVLTGPKIALGFEFILKVFAGWVMLGAGWYYFDSEEKFDEFSKLHIITYIIPFIGVILQYFGIFQLEDIGVNQQIESQYGIEDMTSRYPGFYTDSATNVLYLWTVLPLTFYFINKKGEEHKWFYYVMAVIAVISVYLGFGRGMWLHFGLTVMAWLFINNKYIKMTALIIAAVSVFITGDFLKKFYEDLVQSYEQGKVVGFSGKAERWQIIINDFEKGNTFQQLFGRGIGANSVAVSKVTGRENDGGESDLVAYLYDLGYFGWGLFLIIPVTGLVIVSQRIKRMKSFRWYDYNDDLLLKYRAWFTMICVHLLSLQGSGSRWVSFTFPLWFMAGFILKPSAFWIIQRVNQPSFDERVYLNPQLKARYN